MADGTSAAPRIHPLVAVGPAAVVAGLMLLGIGVCVGYPCLTTGIRYGLWVDRCPATDMRLSVQVDLNSWVRGLEYGVVTIHPRAAWLDGEGWQAPRREEGFSRGLDISTVLLDADGNEVEGFAVEDLERSGDTLRGEVVLPEVPDGDYTLKVDVDAGFEAATVEVPVPLYAPAVVHLMTDRPLYKPGQEVLFRSVALKRTDLTPLDGRPGKWRITAPDGTEMHVEKDAAGAFGIADSSFPLDVRAQLGTWRVAWETGGERDEQTFEVRPFKLPRFTVDVGTSETWYGRNDELVIEGTARYTSGAPIARAPVTVTLSRTSGRWPVPLAWEEPVEATTGADGSFEVSLGEVPGDLIERAELQVVARVTEEAGEVATGATTAVLSEHSLKVDAVTELGDGLVEGFNNRAYLRVATPDGRPLRGAEVTVTNPYDPMDTGRTAEADADGVVALQLDPGDPVTVVRPAPPVRIRPLEPDPVRLEGATVAGRNNAGLTLDERRALDRLHPAIARCGRWTVGNARREVGLLVGPSGAVLDVQSDDDPVSTCLARVMRTARLPAATAADRAAGSDGTRTVRLAWVVPDTLDPSLSTSHNSVYGTPGSLTGVLDDAGRAARRCLRKGEGTSGRRVATVHWSVTEGGRFVRTRLQTHPDAGLSPATLGCVRGALSYVSLPDEAKDDAMGVTRYELRVPRPPNLREPQPTTTTAYELKVVARGDDTELGDTKVVLPVGTIPALRMRATPSLAKPGDQVTVELLRGPSFTGELPEELNLYEGTAKVTDGDVVDKQVTFTIPSDRDGFLHVEWGGARAVIFVQPADPLSVALSTEQAAYAPGADATLTVRTRAGEQPIAAGVGLVGVDSTLAQLAPLVGPDAYGRVTVRAESDRPAFDTFDPRALTLGQVQGENAAKAAVLRISSLPRDPAGDRAVAASAGQAPDTLSALTSNFYRALAATVERVRAWERSAPEGEVMQPDRMVTLWNEALADLEQQGEPAVDGWGRALTLDVLPEDLLVQVDPRQVVADGTRLPEDVVSWTRYVAEEVR